MPSIKLPNEILIEILMYLPKVNRYNFMLDIYRGNITKMNILLGDCIIDYSITMDPKDTRINTIFTIMRNRVIDVLHADNFYIGLDEFNYVIISKNTKVLQFANDKNYVTIGLIIDSQTITAFDFKKKTDRNRDLYDIFVSMLEQYFN